MVEEYSSPTRYGVDSRLFKLDVVAAGLLMLEEVVDSLIVESRLVMRKGVEPNSRLVGFEFAVDVVDAIISVDANSVVDVDPRDVIVVFKRRGVVEEYSSSTRYGVVPWLFMVLFDVAVVNSLLVIRNCVGVDANEVDSLGVIVDLTVVKRCGVDEENGSSTRYGVDPKLSILDAVVVNSMLVIRN